MLKVSQLLGLTILVSASSQAFAATLYNIDFNNAVANKNGQEQGTATFPIPGGATVTAIGHAGPGFSLATGDLYFIDDIWSGEDVRGPYQPINNGVGSVDSVPTGGQISGSIHYADGLVQRPGDTNDIYLGLGLSGSSPNQYSTTETPYNRETAHWVNSFTLTEETTLEFSYQWAAAMGTIVGSGDLFAGAGLNMSSEFFFDTDLDYSNGVSYKFTSTAQTYTGAGNQSWITETSTTTLGPGTYYFGFSLSTLQPVEPVGRYIVVDGVTINSIPEPSALLLGLLGALPLFRRQRNR